MGPRLSRNFHYGLQPARHQTSSRPRMQSPAGFSELGAATAGGARSRPAPAGENAEAGYLFPDGEDREPCEAVRTGRETWDSWEKFCSGDLARSTRDWHRRVRQIVPGGRPLKEVPQFGENDLSRNSRARAHRNTAWPRHLRASYPPCRPSGTGLYCAMALCLSSDAAGTPVDMGGVLSSLGMASPKKRGHSREGGNPEFLRRYEEWIPAFAGMTGSG
jgi:hypothetical protein